MDRCQTRGPSRVITGAPHAPLCEAGTTPTRLPSRPAPGREARTRLETAEHTVVLGWGCCSAVPTVPVWAPGLWSPPPSGDGLPQGSEGPADCPADSLLNRETGAAPHSHQPEPANSLPGTNGASCLLQPR